MSVPLKDSLRVSPSENPRLKLLDVKPEPFDWLIAS